MTKLCPRGKSAAKRKFKVYPSSYANAYASKICAGKIKDPSGVKRKDFKGRKPASMGGSMDDKRDVRKVEQMIGKSRSSKREQGRKQAMGGGLMEATARLKRQGLRGGGLCVKGMNRDAVGKNS